MAQDPRDLGRVREEEVAHGQEIVRTDSPARSLAIIFGILVLIAAISLIIWFLVTDEDENSAESLPGGVEMVTLERTDGL